MLLIVLFGYLSLFFTITFSVKYNNIILNNVTLYRSYVIAFDYEYYITFHKFTFGMGNEMGTQVSLVSDLEFMICKILDDKIVEELKDTENYNRTTYIKLLTQIDINSCTNHMFQDTVNVLVASSSKYSRKEILQFYFQNLQKYEKHRTRVFSLYICLENTYVEYGKLFSTTDYKPRLPSESCLEFYLTLKISGNKGYISIRNIKLENVFFEAGSKGHFHITTKEEEFIVDEYDNIVTETNGDKMIEDIFKREQESPINSKESKIVLIADDIVSKFYPLNQYFDFSNFKAIPNKKAKFQGDDFELVMKKGLLIDENNQNGENGYRERMGFGDHRFEVDTFVGLIILLVFICFFTLYIIVVTNNTVEITLNK